jgi:ElaB/YqjD/DUF883 family membrane-anchored ribosome-binding protein
MSDFTELDVDGDVSDMDAEEARETLSEFMSAHEDNQDAYNELRGELHETVSEYEEKLDKRDEKIAEFKDDLAEQAAEYVNIPKDLVVDRFSIEEIEQIIEEGDEADFSEDDDEDEPDELTTFRDKPEKGKGGGDGTATKYRERASRRLEQNGFPAN